MLAIDADHFKSINDRYGHAAGDDALQFLADVILQYAKGSDYAFRFGGEEFYCYRLIPLLIVPWWSQKIFVNVSKKPH